MSARKLTLEETLGLVKTVKTSDFEYERVNEGKKDIFTGAVSGLDKIRVQVERSEKASGLFYEVRVYAGELQINEPCSTEYDGPKSERHNRLAGTYNAIMENKINGEVSEVLSFLRKEKETR